jgi:hypothetical protein
MSLYFDTKVQFLDDETISTIGVWHRNYPTFAVANYSQERGGSVTLFDDGVSNFLSNFPLDLNHKNLYFKG